MLTSELAESGQTGRTELTPGSAGVRNSSPQPAFVHRRTRDDHATSRLLKDSQQAARVEVWTVASRRSRR